MNGGPRDFFKFNVLSLIIFPWLFKEEAVVELSLPMPPKPAAAGGDKDAIIRALQAKVGQQEQEIAGKIREGWKWKGEGGEGGWKSKGKEVK